MKFKIAIRWEASLRGELETLIWEISAEDEAREAGIRKKIKGYFNDTSNSLSIIRRSTQY